MHAIDTSVAVPLLYPGHPDHAHVATWARDKSLGLAGHALAETYAVVTRLPAGARLSAETAATIIDARFSAHLPLDSATPLHRELARSEITGGAVYDAMVALAAKQHGLTLATRDRRACATYQRVGVPVELVLTRA